MRQLIIARKDLQMPPGKLAAQCCHAFIAFFTRPLKDRGELTVLDGIEQVLYGVDKNIYANGYAVSLQKQFVRPRIEINYSRRSPLQRTWGYNRTRISF